MFEKPQVTTIPDTILHNALKELTPIEFKLFVFCLKERNRADLDEVCAEAPYLWAVYKEVTMETSITEAEQIDAFSALEEKAYLDYCVECADGYGILWWLEWHNEAGISEIEQKRKAFVDLYHRLSSDGALHPFLAHSPDDDPGKTFDRPAPKPKAKPLTAEQKSVLHELQHILNNKRRPNNLGHHHAKRLTKLKKSLARQAGDVCEVCSWHENLVLHHVHYDTWRNETQADLRLLCNRCHTYIHRDKRNDG